MAFAVNAEPSFSDSLLRTLDDFRHSGTCVDTKLIAQADASTEKNFLWCHRCVIAAASPFFRGLFSTDMRERAECSATLHDISFRTLQQLLDFIYTGKAVASSDTECIALLTAAGFLAMDDLINACAKVLSRSMTINNCLPIERAAEASNCLWLVHSARQFALANFEAVCHTNSFLDLDYNRLIWYIQNYAESVMGVGSEHVLDGCDTVYRALGKWTSHQESSILGSGTASSSSSSLVESNSAEVCPCSTESAEQSNNNANFPTVQNLFAQLLSFSIIDTSPSSATSISPTHFYRPRTPQQIGVLIVACGRSPRVWAFSRKRNSWLALPQLPNAIRKAGLCALAGSLYVIGGSVNGVPTNEVWRLDVLPASWHLIRQPADSRPVARWISVKPMPYPRAGHAVAAIGDRFITVVGGYGGEDRALIEQILCYDRVNDVWIESGRCASVPRIGARLVVIANFNYERSRHSSSSSCASENKPPQPPQMPASWILLEVGGLQAGGRLAVIDCYSVTCSQNGTQTPQQTETTLMPDSISISFSGEQLLLPQPVRFAEPVVLSSDEASSARYGENSSRLLVVCSDFGSPTSTSTIGAASDSGYCFVLSFDLNRRLCRVVSPSLPNGTRIRPAVARSSDGGSIFVVGGRAFSTNSPLIFREEPDLLPGEPEQANTNNFKPVATVEMFEEETREWKRLTDMPESRSGHCSALLLFVNY